MGARYLAAAVLALFAGAPQVQRAPMLYGCRVFPPGDYYNADVTRTPVDAYSNERMRSLLAGGATKGLYAGGDQYINVATNSTSLLTFTTADKVTRKIPWSPAFRIQPAADHHAIVLQKDTCTLYEAYDSSYSNGRFAAYSARAWSLGERYPRTRGARIIAGMASGLPLAAGAFRYEDFRRGAIEHALNFAPPQQAIEPFVFAAPASDTGDSMPYGGPGSFTRLIPYGAHIRLRPSFVLRCTCPQSQMVVQALKTYGAYLADTGSPGVGWTGIYITAKPDGVSWRDDSDLDNLKYVTLDNFDVLPIGAIYSIR